MLKQMNSQTVSTLKSLSAIVCVAVALSACATQTPRQVGGVNPSSKEERFPIVVKNGKAYTQQCGYWPTDTGSNFRNAPYPNFGCATQNNLAAMLAKPNDVNKPRAFDKSTGEKQITKIKGHMASTGSSASSQPASASTSSSSSTGTTN